MTALPLQDDEGWRDDNAIKCHDYALRYLREELVISRKALAEIAAPFPDAPVLGLAEHKELTHRVFIARTALNAIAALKGRG